MIIHCVYCAAMSLRDFIPATTKEFQDSNAENATTSEQPPTKMTELSATKVISATADKENSAESEEEEQSLVRKKSKRIGGLKQERTGERFRLSSMLF